MSLLARALRSSFGLDAATPPAASDSAHGDSTPETCPRDVGSPARPEDGFARAELIAQLLEVIVPQPSQWHSFILGHLRRHRVDRLEQLPVGVLQTLVEQSFTLAAARGQQRPGGTT